ncbi:MAG: single-stranded-DNA-specific exonuclease RecJ [Pseudomonadales bacterium]
MTGAKRIVQRVVDETALASLSSSLPDLHPVLQRVYTARGIASKDELSLNLKDLLPFHNIKGINAAVAVLKTALAEQHHILIVGDFDCDGATSTALAIRALRSMGAQQVDYLVPNRFEYGYGLTPEIVDVAKTQSPDVIVTVDNGIASLAGVQRAREAGIKVVITDHHLAGDELPDAEAIVNPNQPGCEFGSKNAAGVGVIFYVMLALRSALRESGWFENQKITEPNLAELLDLVALGTVADVVPLDHNNRILVEQGLRRMRAGKCCEGILALLKVAGKEAEYIVSSDLGFAAGPRLNAAGRLDDMSLGIECLLTGDASAALGMASELDDLNRHRKDIEADMKAQAMANLNAMDLTAETADVGLCLYNPDWHQGVIGILASRVKEQFHRPVIAFANASDDTSSDELKGSARSIPGFHIRDALDVVAKRHPEILQKFGGHAMAAGLSLKKQDLAAFSAAFNDVATQQLSAAALQAELQTDGSLAGGECSMELAYTLNQAGPWGQGFVQPLFEGEFAITQQRLVGEKHLKLQLVDEQSGQSHEAIAFFIDLEVWPNEAKRVRVVYKLDINRFRGNESLQLMIDYLQPLF